MSETASSIRFLLVAALMLAGGLNCNLDRLWFKRNANLTFVAGDSNGLRSFVQPAWTPDGSRLYYLTTREFGSLFEGGTLWQVECDGAGARQVLADTFCALAVSPDGFQLALAVGRDQSTGGGLAVYHVATGILDSFSVSASHIYRVLFTKTSPPRLYYCSSTSGVYRMNIDGSGEELVNPSADEFFKLNLADSIVLPRVHPAGHLAVGVGYVDVPLTYAYTHDIVVIDRDTQDTTFTHANPHKFCDVADPAWSPDGSSVVFVAALVEGEPMEDQNGELWILHHAVPGSD
jgi:dipeptidyl aminopeptidase/acylaminoacyl peptidase